MIVVDVAKNAFLCALESLDDVASPEKYAMGDECTDLKESQLLDFDRYA